MRAAFDALLHRLPFNGVGGLKVSSGVSQPLTSDATQDSRKRP